MIYLVIDSTGVYVSDGLTSLEPNGVVTNYITDIIEAYEKGTDHPLSCMLERGIDYALFELSVISEAVDIHWWTTLRHIENVLYEAQYPDE